MLNAITSILSGRRRAEKHIYVDPVKPLSCQVVNDNLRTLRIAFTDHDNGSNVVLYVPPKAWRGLAKVMGQQAAFIDLQERRDAQLATKASAPDILARLTAKELWEDWEAWCEAHGYTGPLDTPDTIAATRVLQREDYEFLDSWHDRRRRIMGDNGT